MEIILVDHENASAEARACLGRLGALAGVRVLAFRGRFDWAAINNSAARQARGDLLLFLNDDTRVLRADWIERMAGWCIQPGVGCVGAKLLYEDRTVQHGGVILGAGGECAHAFVGLDAGAPGYANRALADQTMSAVTGACLMTRRDLFSALNGFEAGALGIDYADIDYCLRAADAGYRTAWLASVTLLHLESKSRGHGGRSQRSRETFLRERAFFRARWAGRLERDPWYHPAFELHAPPFTRIAAVPGPLDALAGRRRPPSGSGEEKERRREG